MSEDHKEKKFSKFWNLLSTSDVIGLIAATIGAIVSGFSYIKNPILAGFAILAAEGFMLGGWIYIIICKFRYKEKIQEKDNQIRNLTQQCTEIQNEYSLKKVNLEKDKQKALKQLRVISGSVKSNNIHSNDILVKIPYSGDEQYDVLKNMRRDYEEDPDNKDKQKILQDQIIKTTSAYSEHLYELFNRYCRDSTDEAIKLQNAILTLKGIPLTVSVTIKLMNKPYDSREGDSRGIIVYTAFRDNEVYREGEREIGRQKYTINGNTAFFTCLRKDVFTLDNIKKGQESYLNENTQAGNFYNCVLVVPIKLKTVDGREKFFGYYCCDCLNENQDIHEIFENDKTVSQYLFAFAQNMATFLETLDTNWIDRFKDAEGIPDSILGMLMEKIYKPGK